MTAVLTDPELQMAHGLPVVLSQQNQHKGHNDLFPFAMVRYVFNLAFLTTATIIHRPLLLLLLLPGSSSVLAALLQPCLAAI